MLKLYHGSTSVCSQKVRLVLTEKRLPFDGPLLDLQQFDQYDPAYMKLNPNAVVPTLDHDGRIVIESTMINEYLDDAFPEIAMRPADPHDTARMRLWTKQLDDGIHYAINTATFTIANRRAVQQKTPEEREADYAAVPFAERRAKRREMNEVGLKSPLMEAAIKRLDKMLADMETALADAPYLAGDRYSLADAGLTPYVNRMDMLRLTPMWERHRPRVTDWFARMKARPNYAHAILAYDPPGRLKMFNENGDLDWPEVEQLVPSF